MQSGPSSYHESCPVDQGTKEWIDARASWILDQFGGHQIRNCPIVLPTTEFFPRSFEETEEEAYALLRRLCGYLNLRSDQIDLDFYYERERVDSGASSSGMYENDGDRHRVWVELTGLRDPLSMAATMTHELCHVHLLGHGRLSGDEDDHEPLTDLLTVFLGMGIITANDALHDLNWQSGTMESWRIGRQGYLTMPIYGYALALFAKIRDESQPTWDKHLRPDVRKPFRASLRYFHAHGTPDLRNATETTARPTLFRIDVQNDEDVFTDVAWAAEKDAEGVCTFCGESLDEENIDSVCIQCQASIEQNDLELELERQAFEIGERQRQTVLRFGCFVIVVFVLVIWILEMLGIIS